MAENLQIRHEEIANHISEMTGHTIEDSRREVDLSIERLFHWGAYCDKYGGSVQVMSFKIIYHSNSPALTLSLLVATFVVC